MTCMSCCDFTNVFAWARSTLVLNKCQVSTGLRQFRKKIKRWLFRDDTDNLVPSLGQLMAHAFFVDLPWSCLSSFYFSPEQVPTFYRPSTARERNQTKIVSRWHGQSCLKLQPTNVSRILLYIYHSFAWARSTLALNKCQYFTCSRQFRKNIKPRLLSDDTNNLVSRFRQLMTTLILCICQCFN